MSKPARKQQGKEIPQKKTVAAAPVVKQDTKGMTADVSRQFEIKYADLWLMVAVLIVYIPAFSLGFTELDDSIFIREFREYNEQVSNLFTSFTRGLFNPTKDPYYRPLFLDGLLTMLLYTAKNIKNREAAQQRPMLLNAEGDRLGTVHFNLFTVLCSRVLPGGHFLNYI